MGCKTSHNWSLRKSKLNSSKSCRRLACVISRLPHLCLLNGFLKWATTKQSWTALPRQALFSVFIFWGLICICSQMKPVEGLRYSALTPNMNGYQQALASGMQEVAVFGAASEEFSQKNINCSISESISKFNDIMTAARRDKILVRGYVSTVLGCPYSGKVDPQVVVDVASRLMDMCVSKLFFP